MKPVLQLKRLVIFVFVCSLLFTFTNFIYLSVSFLLLTPFLLILQYNLFKYRQSKVFVFLLVYALIVVLSALFYDPWAFMQFDFYRRDGNFLISYMPVIILGLFPINFNVSIYLRLLIYITVVMCFVAGIVLGADSAGDYHFFFVAHNAAGGFIGVVFMLSLGQYLNKREKSFLITSILLFVFLWLTKSRGSIVGVVLGVGSYLYNQKFDKLILMASIIFMVILLVYSFNVWKSIDPTGQKEGKEVSSIDLGVSRGGNFILRIFYLWPRAVDNFIHSPFLGIGFASYDDKPYEYKEVVPYLLTTKTNQTIKHSDSHAHNSYLNILAETGFIGFFFFLGFLYYTRKFLKSKKLNPELRASMLLAFWMIIYSSYTEHRIMTPSQMLPFTLLFGMILSHYNFQKVYFKKKVQLIKGKNTLSCRISPN
ncbi:hypothetical protein BFP72_17855 [Reichenbachiella sp. 5M10]|uniref:O-antigen ligase family protein n=1 Tax=Reichenbachiella sp. 5M10 TaxID=1889772 RepID=UPI000C14832A|nr:O-antigen ligase family protein [Reichenbachiella sp. 5M10]PIB37137.1 hypothetical protein BFP72_17855 [Reichenbachiella sp. 5M10]